MQRLPASALSGDPMERRIQAKCKTCTNQVENRRQLGAWGTILERLFAPLSRHMADLLGLTTSRHTAIFAQLSRHMADLLGSQEGEISVFVVLVYCRGQVIQPSCEK